MLTYMPRKKKELVVNEAEKFQENVSGDVDSTPQRVKDTEQKFLEDLNRYNAQEFITEDSEVNENKKFDKVITATTLKQWIFVIITALIIILAILDIFFGVGKLDKWVYLFGVVTAYEANEAREKNVITKEYKETRQRTRNIVKSAINFRNRIN